MRKIVVVLYGPPGAGKGTQAELVSKKLGLINFDTGKFLESIWYDPARQKEAVVKQEKKLFATGKLNTPSFVTKEVIRETKRIAAAGMGIAFSGSPRTMYEAEREYPVFEKLYGKKNVFIFALDVPGERSVKRNAARMVCKACGYLLLTAYYPMEKAKYCPVCGGPLYKRSLDTAKVMKVRLREYKERTFPIFAFVKNRGYRVVHLDGRPAPYKVAARIYAHIKNA